MSSSGSLDLRRGLPLHYWALPQSLDITGSITLTEGAVAFGVHADIIRASAHGYSCCVKIPRFVGDYSDQAAFREFQLRCMKEMALWASLSHQNILPFLGFDTGLWPSLALISPMILGGTAPSYLLMNPSADRLKIISGIAEGLEYMHSCGVVHGDIKGINTLISVTGSHITPMICDFGSAHSAGIEVSHVDSTGTYRWMARELLRFGLYEDEDDNPCTSTFESDIWAYGMTVLELFTDQVPFPDIPTCTQAVLHIQNGGLPAYPGSPAQDQGLSIELWELIRSCWATDPAARPTASDIVTRLEEFV